MYPVPCTLYPAPQGELTEEAAAAYDRAKKAHERLVSGCTGLAEALQKDMPALEDEKEEAARQAAHISIHSAGGEQHEADAMYDDADSRAFYEQVRR